MIEDPRSGGTPAARLAEIQKLLEAVTPGEWIECCPEWPCAKIVDEAGTHVATAYNRADVSFVAAAPEAVRFLLAEVARLTAENKAHADWARDYGKTPDGEAWQAAIRERKVLRAEVASLREALTNCNAANDAGHKQLAADRAALHIAKEIVADYWDYIENGGPHARQLVADFRAAVLASYGALAPASREPTP